MFKGFYKNFLFVSHGNVDTGSFGSQEKLESLQHVTERKLKYLSNFAKKHGKASEYYMTFGTQPIDDLAELAIKLQDEFSDCLFFASQYVYPKETWVTRLLHSGLAQILQRALHRDGIKLLILPLNLT
jgi:hypothetical protein